MPDIIYMIILLVLLVVCGIFMGYNIRKDSEPKENRLIGKDDFYVIRTALMFVAGHGDEKVRAIKRKAFIALCKASEIYSSVSDEETEEIAGIWFDAWLQALDDEENNEVQSVVEEVGKC